MDIKSAFLNEFFEEDIYMVRPYSFKVLVESHKVCKLNKFIYGLKQVSRSYNLCFDSVVKSFDFIKNEDKPYIYKKISKSTMTILMLYIDDILLGMIFLSQNMIILYVLPKMLGRSNLYLGHSHL